MKLLTIDIETSPNIVHAWGLRLQNIAINQIIEPTRMICFAAKFYGERRMYFASEFHDGTEAMIKLAYDLVSQADVLIHFNGSTFDMPHLYREFILAHFEPPKPAQEIDLLKVVRNRFRFPSNKLDYVSKALGLEGKLSHEGHSLWTKCLAGDEAAWAKMRRYNKQDVVVTEQLYEVLRPWIKSPPHPSLYAGDGADRCQRCGGQDLERRGYAYTALSAFVQYRCRDCGSWSRSNKVVDRINLRGTS